MHSLGMNTLGESGKSSYCNRGSCWMTVLTLQLLAVQQMVLNPRAPLKHRRLRSRSSTPGQANGTRGTSVYQRPSHLGISWTSLTRTLLIDAISHQVHINNQRILLVHGSTGNHAVPYIRNAERYALAGIKKACAFKRQVFKMHLSAKTWMTILQNELPSGYAISYSSPDSPFRYTNSPELKCPSQQKNFLSNLPARYNRLASPPCFSLTRM